ncbi:dual adapter for phosphotyrosine and 3-phosphotyrosine and 3-phosphoinositide-like [Dendronephthya gigantea]|uniref:dual adapter for phosphotyrosine and 3-phosphotyrosine and 3-phosphoinositide-like n=1 Tax=Dendronephthya gigantea TaxID=151771 RepID=UPI00106D6148|nr:dual adapter for phosphotyrosine and 3-phosphotyrosine and 3-phosphoinositide-like [Dendronephthya gigantea]
MKRRMAEALPWYHGPISSEEAIRICTTVGKNGAYLLRDSQREQDTYTLSVLYESDVYHYRIRKTAENNLHLKVMKKDFSSWNELIKFCKTKQDAQKFPQPLVKPIEKSIVDVWDRDNNNWRDSIQTEKRKKKGNSGVPTSKSKGNKKMTSPGKITEFFRRPNKIFSNKEKMEACEQVDRKSEKDNESNDEEWDDTSSESESERVAEDSSYQAISVNCREKFIATADSTGQENEMEYKKGDEMILEGVRTDGWWYCLNKATEKRGWVYEASLKKC